MPNISFTSLYLSSFQNLRLSILGFFGSPELQFIMHKYLLITYYGSSTGLGIREKLRAKNRCGFVLMQFKIYSRAQT